MSNLNKFSLPPDNQDAFGRFMKMAKDRTVSPKANCGGRRPIEKLSCPWPVAQTGLELHLIMMLTIRAPSIALEPNAAFLSGMLLGKFFARLCCR